MVLLILAVVWGVFLVPQVLRARAERGPADSIGAFRNQLSVLDKAGSSVSGVSSLAARRAMHQSHSISPGAPLAAYGVGYRRPTALELQRRRQLVLLGLLGAVIVTLGLGLLFTPFFLLHVIADVALVGYVALLARTRALAVEREMKVRYLRPGPSAAGVGALRQAYASGPSAGPQQQLRRSAIGN